MAVRSPGGVPKVSGAHHPDGRVPAVVATPVCRVPGQSVASEAIVGGCRDAGGRPRRFDADGGRQVT